MKCQHCQAEINLENEATLNVCGKFLQIVIICPACGAEHFDSITTADLSMRMPT